MLQSIRHNHRLKTLITLALLLAQCLLFVAEATHAAAASDQAHHLLVQSTTADTVADSGSALDPLTPADESRCDHCCACHGHTSHLALLTILTSPALVAQPAALASYASVLPAILGNNIYRPPIV